MPCAACGDELGLGFVRVVRVDLPGRRERDRSGLLQIAAHDEDPQQERVEAALSDRS